MIALIKREIKDRDKIKRLKEVAMRKESHVTVIYGTVTPVM
jgi:hypothetical protein